ncbi:unnamed protein product, partial [Amoebophrya sp. A120]
CILSRFSEQKCASYILLLGILGCECFPRVVCKLFRRDGPSIHPWPLRSSPDRSHQPNSANLIEKGATFLRSVAVSQVIWLYMLGATLCVRAVPCTAVHGNFFFFRMVIHL